MSFRDAVDLLVTARARAIAGGGFAVLAVDGALAALVAGRNGEALRELAGLGPLRELLDMIAEVNV
ncbi:hypothetical protein [Microbacterium flavescens]|uniref:hypothetical protein n=1 Tax=Microbacterium flavescens TaxID=69366 RepID=UPI001BDEB82A|nr:hypothetical protein [Microbacterium flavescens]BFF09232.1 hypothetical protein GCM10025699_05350 [Microbacterium flavescens]